MKIKHAALPLLVVILYLYLNLFANALTDDAFITLRYVKTFLHTGTWGFLPGYVTNAVTSPLNVFLLAFAGVFLGPTIKAVIWLSASILAGTIVLLIRISIQLFDTDIFGYLAAVALIFNPLVVSTLGLESILFVGLYVLSTYLYLTNRWSLLAVALGLLTITRFDGILFFLTTLLLVPTFKMRFWFAGVYLLCIAPWYIFSWIYLGSLLPDTLFIKVGQPIWGKWDFLNGLDLYRIVYPWETAFSFLLLPLSLLLFNKQVRNLPAVQFLLLTSVMHFVGYSSLHVPPYYWYYIPQVTAILLISSFGLGVLFQEGNSKIWGRKGIRSITAIFLILQILGMFFILTRDGFLIKEMPIHTNWATHEQYKEIGEWLREHNAGRTILVDGEVGTLGYYCDCSLSSFFSDRKWLEQHVGRQISGEGIKPILYKMNFLFLEKEAEYPQPAYLLSEIPGGSDTGMKGTKEWKTKTKWLADCLIKLSNYPP